MKIEWKHSLGYVVSELLLQEIPYLRKLSIEDINYCESSFKNMEQTIRRNLIFTDTVSPFIVEGLKLNFMQVENLCAKMHGYLPMMYSETHFNKWGGHGGPLNTAKLVLKLTNTASL